MQSSQLTELDLQIVHALQIDPRVSWTDLAAILDGDAVTLARRWERLTIAGLAWSTAFTHPEASGAAVAIVELACAPGQIRLTADAMAHDPGFASVDITAGGRDIVGILIVPDDRTLTDYVLDRLGRLPGVSQTRTHVVSHLFRIGSDWTVQALSPSQVERVPRPRPPRTGAARHVPDGTVEALRRTLADRPRATYREVGQVLGISPQRAADAIATCRASGELVLRTDLAASVSPWPFVSWVVLDCAAPSLEDLRTRLHDMPAVQLAGLTAGRPNLLVALTGRTRKDLLAHQSVLEQRIARARIVNASPVLRPYKHLGRRIGDDGRRQTDEPAD